LIWLIVWLNWWCVMSILTNCVFELMMLLSILTNCVIKLMMWHIHSNKLCDWIDDVACPICLITIFTLQFGLVWNLKMCLKFVPCFILKNLLERFIFIRGCDNVPKCLVKFLLSLIIIWRICKKCIRIAMDYLMARRIKHYWLMINLTTHFQIQSGVVFFLNHSRDKCC
jgi:hypothetical protein